jgi:hypothetical protein
MNSRAFIRTFNSIAESRSVAYEAPYLTTLETSDDEGTSVSSPDSDMSDWLIGLAAALGLTAIGTAVLNRFLNNKKMLECLRLMKRHLNVLGGTSSGGRSVFSALFEKVFGFQSRYLEQQLPGMGLVDLTKKFKQLFDLVGTEGLRLIKDQIDQLPADPTDGDRAQERLDELKNKLRSCLKVLPGLAKDFIKEVLIKKFPNLAQPITDAIKYAIDRYLGDGKLEEFAYTVVIAIGSALTTGMAVDLAALIVSGFNESYGVTTTVLVAALAAGLVALSTFLLAGGTLASIGVWLSGTAIPAVMSAASAAGAALSPAAQQRIQQILEDIARRANLATQ